MSKRQKAILKSAEDNRIWLNAIQCIRPSVKFKVDLADVILQMLDDDESTIPAYEDKCPFAKLKTRELIVRINKS